MMWDIYQDGSKFKHFGEWRAENAVLTAKKNTAAKKQRESAAPDQITMFITLRTSSRVAEPSSLALATPASRTWRM